MRTQFKFTLRLICTPEYKYTPEYIYKRVFFAHANRTLGFIHSFKTGNFYPKQSRGFEAIAI